LALGLLNNHYDNSNILHALKTLHLETMEKYFLDYLELLKKLKSELPNQRDDINKMVTEKLGSYVVHPKVEEVKTLSEVIKSSFNLCQVLSSQDRNYYHYLESNTQNDLLKQFIQNYLIENEDDKGNPKEERILLFNRTHEGISFIMALPFEVLFNFLIEFVNQYPNS